MPTSLVDKSASATLQRVGTGHYVVQILAATDTLWVGQRPTAMTTLYLRQYDRIYLRGPFYFDKGTPGVLCTELTTPISEGGTFGGTGALGGSKPSEGDPTIE